MTRAKKAKQARRAQRAAAPPPSTRPGPGLLLAAGLAAAGLVLAAALLWRSGGGETEVFSPPPAEDAGPVHVHGLGIDPADGALYIATHTGLYRAAPGRLKAERVGERRQDTMGFTVAGARRFLGSGHPDLREAREQGLPSQLGLIESTDGGESWEPVSLLGEADFHVLRFAGTRVYAYDVANDRLMISADRGRTWTERRPPAPLVDVAVDPGDPRRLVAASGEGLLGSRDEGETWSRIGDTIGYLAWPERSRLYLVTGGGLVLASPDGGKLLRRAGDIGGEPAAFLAQGPLELYAALHDGTVKRSTDGGRTWAVRSRP